MKKLIFIDSRAKNNLDKLNIRNYFSSFTFNNRETLYALVEEDDPYFDPFKRKDDVLVKVIAFSINFRDLGILTLNLQKFVENPHRLTFTMCGSDFCGKVVSKGINVNNLEIGDFVINDNSYESPINNLSGIPTNYSSQQFIILNKEKLAKIPSQMSKEHAACFSIGFQTAFAIKDIIGENKKVLISSANSSTSNMVIQAIQAKNHITAITTTKGIADKLFQAGVKNVVHINDKGEINHKIVDQFDMIFDPFSDLFMDVLLHKLSFEGKYITCGYANQVGLLEKSTALIEDIIPLLIVKKLTIKGACLGSKNNLIDALREYQDGTISPVIYRVYKEDNLSEFIYDAFVNRKNFFGTFIFKF